MLTFKKYSSIENHFIREFMEKVVAEMPQDLEYVVQEKVHGANTSFLCDGNEVKFAKRTSMLADDEKFYDYPELLDAYKDKVMKLFNRIKEGRPEVVAISVFGEMFGGLYPHNEVKANRKLTLIQKGVCYTPEHEFYGFDIYLFDGENDWYLPVDEVNGLFESEGFFYAKTLFRGTLAECMKYPNAFPSKISEWLGFPAIEDNICEGIVIRPVTPMYLRNGSRVLIKSKNERFAEKKSVKKRNKLFAEPVPYSEELKALVAEVEAYVTENRLTNVVSHIGEVHVPKDFGKIMGLFSKDVLEDFLKEHGGDYACLEKSEQKLLNKELNKLATDLVKKVYMSQAYIL
ncbi:MAG: RNA ligase, Rnl2 family [Paludibacteraceae bacterium]|nr:RNA ligase, Rnl2 family [Paludibacteraceae bacterium]